MPVFRRVEHAQYGARCKKESAEYLERWLSERGRERERERERGLECLLKTAGPHTELKQEIPASGGRGGFGAAKGS